MSRNRLELVVFVGLQGAGKTTCYRLARNRRRQGRARVPEVAIFSIARRLRPPSSHEGFDWVQIARMTAARTFELDESASAADPWPVGGRLRQLDH
jgi:predicted ATPase